MASFDFVECAGNGYRFLWTQRRVILPLATLPFLFKLFSYLTVITMALDENILRQGLFLLPSYFVEGWLIAALMRSAIYGEPPTLAGSGDRLRALKAGAGIYVLTKLIIAFFSGIMIQPQTIEPVEAQPGSPTMFLAALITLVLIVWMFRFLWLYVPAALGYSPIAFLKKIKAFRASLYMFGLWMLCFVPGLLALVICNEIAASIFVSETDTPAAAHTYSMAMVQSLIEIIIAMIASVAMAYGVRAIMTGEKNPPLV